MLYSVTMPDKTKAEEAIKGITEWFEKHPRRVRCRTQFSYIRRDHIREDVEKSLSITHLKREDK
ncbi:MAG: hypothetical protein ACRDFB_03660 [Rhabdochlamydiaceae bacterium]